MSEDYPHLHPDVRPLVDADGETRIASIRGKRWIEHGAAGAILRVLQETLEQPASERMENLLLIAESGMGGAGQGSARVARGMPAEGRPA